MTSPGRVCCDTLETQAHREWCIVGDQRAEFARGIAEGRRLEREAVVAWLRDASAQGWLRKATGALADDIERGEHEEGSGG